MSEAPDSGIGRTQDSVGWCNQSAFQPTIPRPIRRKRRAGGWVVTVSNAGANVETEGAMWGTPRKRALFGPVVSHLVVMSRRPSWDDRRTMSIRRWPSRGGRQMTSIRSWPRWPPRRSSIWRRSSIVDLADVVARLQKEIEEFRAESGYGSAQRSAVPTRTSGWSGFTSTPVPMYTGKSSWDQYLQVFAAIACPNGWDGVTAALQLVSHLEGDALNVALLVPAPQ